MDGFSEYYEAVEPGRRERAYARATAIGLQAVDGLSTSRHLSETARRHFHKNSWCFRNALARANYENVRLGVEKTQLPLEEFFKVLLFDENLELKNRYLRIGAEYGTAVATATSDLHRHDKRSDVGANVGVNFRSCFKEWEGCHASVGRFRRNRRRVIDIASFHVRRIDQD